MLKIGVLISGGGTNLQALIDNKNNFHKTSIDLIISNRDSYGLKRGKKAGIESIFISPDSFENEDEYNSKLIEEFKKRDINLIVLAGYLKILNKDFIDEFEGKIINIHPSLLPEFCGHGFYGERVHREVLESGVKKTGATLHFVDTGIDTGNIILQRKVDIEKDDSVKSLKEKVLKVEHEIIVEGVKLFSEGKMEEAEDNLNINRGEKDEKSSY